MWKILIPKKIAYGENAAKEFEYLQKNTLIITTTESKIYEKWIDYMGIKNYTVYDKVTPDPAIETIEKIKSEYEGKEISHYIGLGGGRTRRMQISPAKSQEFQDFDPHNIWNRRRNDNIRSNRLEHKKDYCRMRHFLRMQR